MDINQLVVISARWPLGLGNISGFIPNVAAAGMTYRRMWLWRGGGGLGCHPISVGLGICMPPPRLHGLRARGPACLCVKPTD